MVEENVLLKREVADKDRFKAVATMASGLAHEIKNPLTAIKTFADYLPQKLNDKAFLEKFSRIVAQEVNRIDDMVHQLLEFGKPSPPQKKPTNIHKLLDDTLDVFSNKYIEKNIQLIREFHADSKITLCIDPNQMRQAVVNILINAIEAMGSGGTLTVRSSYLVSRSSLKKKNSLHQPPTTNNQQRDTNDEIRTTDLRISFKDTGNGISPEDLPHIFDPFYSKKDMGTGLGLPITLSIIENHGGKIDVKSTAGVGTEVVLILPVKPV